MSRKVTTKRQVTNMVRKFDPDIAEDEPAFETYSIILAALVVGPNVKKIATFLEIPRLSVAKRAKNLREQKVWIGNKIHANWDGEDGGVSFIADCLVADGLLARA